MSNLQEFRQTLTLQRAEVMASLGIRFDGLSSLGRVSEEDQATVTHEEFISMARNRIEHDKLRQLNAALQRMEDGDYGVCQECGEEIAPKRLKAIPWAKFCVTCQDLVAARAEDNEVAPAEAVLSE
jgi:DnaK suppressor protein